MKIKSLLVLGMCGLLVVFPTALRKTRRFSPAEANTLRPYLMAQLGHSESVCSVAFSPDGRYALTGSQDHSACLWEIATGKEVRRFQGHSAGVHSVIFSPNGRYVLTASDDKTARLWETATGEEIRKFEGHTSYIHSAAFSSDGRFVLTASWDKTARLWETDSGKEIRRFEGHTASVNSAVFSSDGRYVLTASYDKTARLWETATGKEIRKFEVHSAEINSAVFSPNGRYVLTAGDDKTARLWKTATGKEIRKFEGHSPRVETAVFSPDGRFILTVEGDAHLWKTATGKLIEHFGMHPIEGAKGIFDGVRSASFSSDGRFVLTACGQGAGLFETITGKQIRWFQGHSDQVCSTDFSSDGHYVLVVEGAGNAISLIRDKSGNITGKFHYALPWGSDRAARLWETNSGKVIRQFDGAAGGFHSAILSSTGQYLLTGSFDKTARLWDATTGKEIRRFEGHSDLVLSAIFSADGQYVLTASQDKTARLWETATGKEIRRFEGHSEIVTTAIFSPDDRYVLTGSWDHTSRLWETATGKEIRKFEVHSAEINSAVFSPDGRFVLTASWDKTARLWETESGKEVRKFEGHTASVNSAVFSSDGRYVLTASYDKTARLWETATGKEIRKFEVHSAEINSAVFSPNGRFVMIASSDGTSRLWETASGKELCSLISFDDGTWAVTDPSGRYDASNAGDVNGLCWVVNNRSIDLTQLKERYYEPGLLAKILTGQPLRAVAAFENVPLFPEVAQQALGNNRYSVQLSDLGGGIGKVQVYVNNVRFLEDARLANTPPTAKTLSFTFDVSQAPTLRQGGSNEVRVVAYNAAGWLPSRGVRMDSGHEGTLKDNSNVPRRLYAIIVGISDYAGPNLHLDYAANDAESFAQAVQLSARNFQAIVGTEVHLFSSSSAPGTLPATKVNLQAAFEEVRRKAKPEDILLVYLAGHGVSLSLEDGLYCFLTQNANSADTTKLTTDTDLRQATTLTSAELGGWLTGKDGIRAGYRVMVLDTCAAGAAEAKLTEKRDAPTDQILAMERFKDRTGFHLLMGCAADQASYEATPYGHGLLTYALLQGMQGAALRDGEWVDVRTLFGYAEDQVPKLMAGLQQPRYQKPGAGSFDIGKLPLGERKQIVLAQPKPLVLRPTLLNGVKSRDDLNLSGLLAKQLRSVSEVNARGAALVYVEAEALPGAVIPSGTYRVEGEAIKVQLVLSRDDKEIASLSVGGTKGDIPALIHKLSDAITTRLN